jgi:hypothetical protein
LHLQRSPSGHGPERIGSGGWLGVLLALASWSTPAIADSPVAWLEHYDVPAACAGPAAFQAMVLRRLVAPPEALERTRVRVDITEGPGAGALLGRVSAREASGASTSRDVADTSCHALVNALSLVVALSVDEASPAHEAPRSEPSPAARSPGVTGAGWGSDLAELREQPEVDSAASTSVATARAAFRAEPLLRAAVQSAVAPELALGFGAGVALEWAGQGLWRPRLELVGMVLDSPSLSLPLLYAEIEIDAVLVNASFCPLDLAAADVWSLRPCLDLDVGRLTASGTGFDVRRPGQRHAPWLSSGMSLHGGVAPWAGPVQLSVLLGGFVPMARHEFYFSPGIAAFDVPVAGWRASAGLGVTF